MDGWFSSLSLCIYVSLFLWSRRCSIYHCYLIIFWNTHTRINSGNRNGGFELACLEQSNKTVIIIVHKGDTHNVETDRPTGPNRSACFFFVFLLLPPHHSRIPPLSNTSIFNGSNTPSPSQRVYMIQIKTFEMKNFFSVWKRMLFRMCVRDRGIKEGEIFFFSEHSFFFVILAHELIYRNFFLRMVQTNFIPPPPPLSPLPP